MRQTFEPPKCKLGRLNLALKRRRSGRPSMSSFLFHFSDPSLFIRVQAFRVQDIRASAGHQGASHQGARHHDQVVGHQSAVQGIRVQGIRVQGIRVPRHQSACGASECVQGIRVRAGHQSACGASACRESESKHGHVKPTRCKPQPAPEPLPHTHLGYQISCSRSCLMPWLSLMRSCCHDMSKQFRKQWQWRWDSEDRKTARRQHGGCMCA